MDLLELLPMVCEFVDVFLEHLSGISSCCEVEFTIDLVPGMGPIYVTPYCLVTVELMELRIKIYYLMSKGSIWVSA